MNKLFRFSGLAIAALTMAAFTGCNSAPELTREHAQVLLQANYDQRPPEQVVIMVNSTGLKQGYDAHYWKLTKVYPNRRWADYAITPEGKKVFTLNGGGDVIQWRPDQDGFGHFFITTVATNHAGVRDVEPPEDDIIPNVAKAKSVYFVEAVNLNGVPQPLQDIAHNPGNTLSSRKMAEFALEGDVWKVHSIQ